MENSDYTVAGPIVAMVWALLPAFVWVYVAKIAWWTMWRGRIAALVTTVVAVACVVGNVQARRRTAPAAPRRCDVRSTSLYDAYRYVHAPPPSHAMILIQRCYAPPGAGLITPRRVVLERAENWRLVCDITAIVADVRAFY